MRLVTRPIWGIRRPTHSTPRVPLRGFGSSRIDGDCAALRASRGPPRRRGRGVHIRRIGDSALQLAAHRGGGGRIRVRPKRPLWPL